MATIPAAPDSAVACSRVFDNHVDMASLRQPDQCSLSLSTSLGEVQRPLAIFHALGDQSDLHEKCLDAADASHSTVGLLSLSKNVRWPPLLPQSNEQKSSFWQADGSFSCDWAALRAGEAFCSSVDACCVSCLSRTLGGPSEMTSALLEKLRAGAKTAIKEEITHLIEMVKASAASSAVIPGQDGSGLSEASEDLTQQLLKHPALQAVAFLSVHERRLAVFEMWLDRWQVLSRDYKCTCGSAEATSASLNRIASGSASTNAEAKTAVEALRAQVARLWEDARQAHQEEESVVAEARSLSVELMKKQQQLLLAIERVKALEKVREDPTFGIVERAQQQLRPASSDAKISTYKESLSFIADKCNKLASLTQLIQQQFPQTHTAGLRRPSWEASQLVYTAGEAADAPADLGLLGVLRELQTPHASMHSPHSLRARGSSHAASPVLQTKDRSAAPPFQQPPTDDDDALRRGQNSAPIDVRTTRSPIHPGNLRATGEAPASSARGAVPAASLNSPDGRHRNNALVEPGSNKRTREPEEASLRSRWRRALPSAIHADLDLDAEAAWQPVEPTPKGDPLVEAVWVDSFLRRRPDAK